MAGATIDLIPAAYRAELHARRVLKWYLPVLVALIGGIVGARIMLELEHAGLERDLNALQADISLDAEQQRRFDELAAVRDTLQRRLGVLDSLRGGLAADRMFAAIDQAANEETWFRRWTFRRSGEIVRQAPETVHTGYLIVVAPATAGGEEQAWRLDTHMEITGSALDHTAIASFVERLQHHADITDARILRTSSRREGHREIIDFDLAVSVSDGGTCGMKGPMITAQLPLRSLYAVLAMLFVLCGVAGHLYVLKQPLAAIATLDDELFETRRARPMDSPAADRIAVIEAEIAELRARLGGGAPALAPNEMVAFVIGQLDVLARARRIQLVSVQPGATTRVFEFDEIPFHIEVIGGYFGLVEWLQEAENKLGPMVIKSFDLEPVPAGEARRMRLTMVSYRSDEGET